MEKQKPTYRFTIKANNRLIKHFVNREDFGFHTPACADNDEKMRDHAVERICDVPNEAEVIRILNDIR